MSISNPVPNVLKNSLILGYMFRFIFVFFLLCIRLSCFAEEVQNVLRSWQVETLEHISNGSINLFLNEPSRALGNFEKATELVDKLDKSASAIDFLISFGQTIAFDALGFKEQCKQSIGELLLAINQYDDKGTTERNIYGSLTLNDQEDAVDFLRGLAHLAPSVEVRELLFAFADQIAEELLSPFKFAEPAFFEAAANWDFDYGQDPISITQCKSRWRKFKNWCIEVVQFLGIVKEGCQHAKGIKQTFDQWNNPPNQFNPHDPHTKMN